MFRNVFDYMVCFGFFSVFVLYKLCDRPVSIPYHVTLHNLRDRHADAQDESSSFQPTWIGSKALHHGYIKGKQVPLELYLKCLCNLEGKLDELRILIIDLSRCFHVHTLILIDGSYWTSRAKNDYKNTS